MFHGFINATQNNTKPKNIGICHNMSLSMGKKWTKGCPADNKLREMLEKGEATFEMAPITVKRMHNEFKDYSDTVFRNHWKKIRSQMGIHLPDSDLDIPMNSIENEVVQNNNEKKGKSFIYIDHTFNSPLTIYFFRNNYFVTAEKAF